MPPSSVRVAVQAGELAAACSRRPARSPASRRANAIEKSPDDALPAGTGVSATVQVRPRLLVWNTRETFAPPVTNQASSPPLSAVRHVPLAAKAPSPVERLRHDEALGRLPGLAAVVRDAHDEAVVDRVADDEAVLRVPERDRVVEAVLVRVGVDQLPRRSGVGRAVDARGVARCRRSSGRPCRRVERFDVAKVERLAARHRQLLPVLAVLRAQDGAARAARPGVLRDRGRTRPRSSASSRSAAEARSWRPARISAWSMTTLTLSPSRVEREF